jgi:hypothetical protein
MDQKSMSPSRIHDEIDSDVLTKEVLCEYSRLYPHDKHIIMKGQDESRSAAAFAIECNKIEYYDLLVKHGFDLFTSESIAGIIQKVQKKGLVP